LNISESDFVSSEHSDFVFSENESFTSESDDNFVDNLQQTINNLRKLELIWLKKRKKSSKNKVVISRATKFRKYGPSGVYTKVAQGVKLITQYFPIKKNEESTDSENKGKPETSDTDSDVNAIDLDVNDDEKYILSNKKKQTAYDYLQYWAKFWLKNGSLYKSMQGCHQKTKQFSKEYGIMIEDLEKNELEESIQSIFDAGNEEVEVMAISGYSSSAGMRNYLKITKEKKEIFLIQRCRRHKILRDYIQINSKPNIRSLARRVPSIIYEETPKSYFGHDGEVNNLDGYWIFNFLKEAKDMLTDGDFISFKTKVEQERQGNGLKTFCEELIHEHSSNTIKSGVAEYDNTC
ncbi:5486_t:CDS:10, partial [Funneliformis geosporum]